MLATMALPTIMDGSGLEKPSVNLSPTAQNASSRPAKIKRIQDIRFVLVVLSYRVRRTSSGCCFQDSTIGGCSRIGCEMMHRKRTPHVVPYNFEGVNCSLAGVR